MPERALARGLLDVRDALARAAVREFVADGKHDVVHAHAAAAVRVVHEVARPISRVVDSAASRYAAFAWSLENRPG
jgi:hypothetical protein